MIETKRLLITEFEKKDWKAVHEYACRADILIYEIWGPNTVADTQAFIERAIAARQVQPRMLYEFAIFLKEEKKLIGGCTFRKKANLEEGTIGYIIHPDHWQQGYATEAVQGLTHYIKTDLNIHRIEATCDTRNIASQKVLEKCGFQQKNYIKDHFEMKGTMRDTFLYAI